MKEKLETIQGKLTNIASILKGFDDSKISKMSFVEVKKICEAIQDTAEVKALIDEIIAMGESEELGREISDAIYSSLMNEGYKDIGNLKDCDIAAKAAIAAIWGGKDNG